LANFLSKHNPSTILSNPSTILRNPSTILAATATPTARLRSKKLPPLAFPDSLSDNTAFQPRKMKQAPQTKREEFQVAMKGKFRNSL
jgi:hypothetical protein